MTEDLALIESLEESKRVADEISEKVAEAKTTEEQINEARNKVGLARQHAIEQRFMAKAAQCLP